MKHILHATFFVILLLFASSCALEQKNRQYADGVSGIQGSYWMLMSLQGQDIPDIPDTNTAYIRFEEGSDEVTGYGGCNRLRGSYRLNNSSLQLTNLSTTRMSCPSIEQESFLIAMLEKVDSFEIAGDVLTLFHKNDAVATFKAGNDQNRMNGQ